MYDELVGDLRYCGKGDCNGCRRYTKDTRFCNTLLREAADAIEELRAKYDRALTDLVKAHVQKSKCDGVSDWEYGTPKEET